MLRRFKTVSPLAQIQALIDDFEIQDVQTALLICRWIPNRCPFERRIRVMGGWEIQIPPLCKLNPLYPQLTRLRLRSLLYLMNQQTNAAISQVLGSLPL